MRGFFHSFDFFCSNRMVILFIITKHIWNCTKTTDGFQGSQLIHLLQCVDSVLSWNEEEVTIFPFYFQNLFSECSQLLSENIIIIIMTLFILYSIWVNEKSQRLIFMWNGCEKFAAQWWIIHCEKKYRNNRSNVWMMAINLTRLTIITIIVIKFLNEIDISESASAEFHCISGEATSSAGCLISIKNLKQSCGPHNLGHYFQLWVEYQLIEYFKYNLIYFVIFFV